MRRTWSFWLVLILIGIVVPLSAQEAGSGEPAGEVGEITNEAETVEEPEVPVADPVEAPEVPEAVSAEVPAEEIVPEPEEEQPEIQWDSYVPDLYRAGDKIFSITAGLLIPTVFTGSGMEGGDPSKISLGGTGTLSYSYFFSPNWFWGGELQGMFAGTRGGNMLFIVPFGLHVGYQFVLGRIEVPVRLMTGAAPQKYLELGYFGWIIRPGISGFYRYDADWSFGLTCNWWMLPQWPQNGKFVFGNFLEISFTARYHF